jgi:uncharacterized membrane protein YeaQ/YmgE (transglycosylase-associated protein family)
MEYIALLALGVLAGQVASLLYGGYSLGAFGNGIAGLTGALFTGKYVAAVFGMSEFAGMFVGGVLSTVVILAVFSAGEYLRASKKKHLF